MTLLTAPLTGTLHHTRNNIEGCSLLLNLKSIVTRGADDSCRYFFNRQLI